MILLFSVVFGVGVYFTLTSSPLYFASTTIKIEPQNPMVTGLVEMLPTQAGPPALMTITKPSLLSSATGRWRPGLLAT